METEDKILNFSKIIPTLGDVFRRRFTGALRLDSEAGTRVFYLRDGDLISIGTTIDREKIDEILIRDGKLTKEHIKEALEKSSSFAQIGKQLIAFGFLKHQELEAALKKQANLILHNVLKETNGKISFMEGHEPTRTDFFYYPTHLWLLDFLMGVEEREFIFQLLPPLDHFIGKEPEMEEFLGLLPWDGEDKELAMKLNGSFTLAEATSYSKKKEMEVYKKLAFLSAFGVIKSFGKTQKKPAQAPLFNPIEVQEKIPPLFPVNLDSPIRKKQISKKKKIFYYYPLAASGVVILILAGIFIYYAYISKPPNIEIPPVKVEEVVPPDKVEEESDTMVLSPQKKEGMKIKEEEKKEVTALPEEEIQKKDEKKPETSVKQEKKPGIVLKEKPKEPNKETAEKKEPQKNVFFNDALNYLSEARALPQTYYTVQILIACQEETISKLKKEYPDLNFWFIPIDFKGRDCYKLFYEKCKNKEEAQRLRDALPENLLKDKPQIVSFPQALKDARN